MVLEISQSLIEEVVHTSPHLPVPYKNFVSGENKKSRVIIPYHDR
jgi:hypothetical protein